MKQYLAPMEIVSLYELYETVSNTTSCEYQSNSLN